MQTAVYMLWQFIATKMLRHNIENTGYERKVKLTLSVQPLLSS